MRVSTQSVLRYRNRVAFHYDSVDPVHLRRPETGCAREHLRAARHTRETENRVAPPKSAAGHGAAGRRPMRLVLRADTQRACLCTWRTLGVECATRTYRAAKCLTASALSNPFGEPGICGVGLAFLDSVMATAVFPSTQSTAWPRLSLERFAISRATVRVVALAVVTSLAFGYRAVALSTYGLSEDEVNKVR